MKTDRELLELAARAAGLTDYRYVTPDVEHRLLTERGITVWNPLQDNDHALRLAVKLCIAPIQDKDNKVCTAYWTDIQCCVVGYESDPEAATRRAITRAAAQIQLNKENGNAESK